MTLLKSLALLAMGTLLIASSASAITINEIRIDNGGADTDEYFELKGQPGESLDGLTYIVIGDGATGSGTIESVTDLTGLSIAGDGFFAVHKSGTTGVCTGYDLDLTLNFENSDNVTHLLVRDFTGANADDLDTDDDGTLDATPWSGIVDSIALIESVGTGDLVYSSNQVGPDGTFVPGMVFNCPTGWIIGSFDVCVDDTPGAQNNCPVATEQQNWGSVKSRF